MKTNKLSCKDLMIGDWVEFIQFDGQGFYAPVEALNDDSTFAESGCFADNMVKPIPLTAEILEKNGFVRSKVFEVWKYEDGEVSMLWKPFPFLTVDCDSAIVKFPCEHVHKLQHAMRLCGIEKTIEL